MEFERHNLAIIPKSRLMSAKSFVDPDRVYTANNEYVRLAESLKGLSQTSDELIEGFIEKQKEKGKIEAEKLLSKAMQNPEGNKDIQAFLQEQKKAISKTPNLLGVSYWTEQYLAKGEAERLFAKEKASMELDYINKGYANLTPEQYDIQLGKDREEFEKELSTYSQEVQDYFYKQNREALIYNMRERHIQNVSQKNIEMRNVISTNKKYDILQNNLDGLSSIVYDTQDIEPDETLATMSYEDYEKSEATKEEASLLSKLYGWEVSVGNNSKIISLEQQEKIMLYRKLNNSPIVENMLIALREDAKAGMTPSESMDFLYNSFTRLIREQEDLGDEAELLFNIILDKANKDKTLQGHYNSWQFTSNNKQSQDINIALFNMSEAKEKGQLLRKLANEQAMISEQNRQAEELKNYTNGTKFLYDAENAGKFSVEDIMSLSNEELAKKVGLDPVKFSEAIESYRTDRIKSLSNPVNEYHLNQRDMYLHYIYSGKIVSEEQLYNAKLDGAFHTQHYPELLRALEGTKSSKGSSARTTALALLQGVYADIDGSDQMSPREKDGLKTRLFDMVFRKTYAREWGEDPNSYKEVLDLYQAVGIASKGRKLYDKGKPDETTLQTQDQFAESIINANTTPVMNSKTKISVPIFRIEKDDTLENFYNNNPMGQVLSAIDSLTEEQRKEIFESVKQVTAESDRQHFQKQVEDKLKSGNYNSDQLVAMLQNYPDTVNKYYKKKYGGEIEVVDGKVVPKDEKRRKMYNKALSYYKTLDNDARLLRGILSTNMLY